MDLTIAIKMLLLIALMVNTTRSACTEGVDDECLEGGSCLMCSRGVRGPNRVGKRFGVLSYPVRIEAELVRPLKRFFEKMSNNAINEDNKSSKEFVPLLNRMIKLD